MRNKIVWLPVIISVLGCATVHPDNNISPQTPVGTTEQQEDVADTELDIPDTSPASVLEDISLQDVAEESASSAEEAERLLIPSGSVFAKTVFEGVVKTSYVQLSIVDITDPQKVFQLIIGDKDRQKNLPWNIQTVKPGYFFIDLPVGRYRINSITIPVGTTLATEPMDVSFDVELDKTIYLGTLRVIGEKERIKLGGVPIIKPGFEYTLQVLDERTEAQKEFLRRFPEHHGSIDYQLMEINAFRNTHELLQKDNS